MSNDKGAVRANISLPQKLKAEMDAVEGVNWSAVAADAFRLKLLDLKSKKEVGNMDDVIARMKAAEELDSNQDRQDGCAAGEAWVKNQARPKQLRALQDAVDDPDIGSANYLVGLHCNGHNQGALMGLYRDIHPRKADDGYDEARNFWEEVLGEDDYRQIEDEDFAIAFVEAALEEWGKIQSKI